MFRWFEDGCAIKLSLSIEIKIDNSRFNAWESWTDVSVWGNN